MKKNLIIMLFMLITSIAYCTNYYVSASGSDLNDGLSESSSWKTISKVNSSTFNAGDRILLKAGDIFTGMLNIPSSGSVGNNITISSYGSGIKPEIRMYGEIPEWTTSSNWTLYSTGIYRMALVAQPNRLWINGDEKKKSMILAIDNTHDWIWQSNYLYVKAFSNPATFFNSIITANIDANYGTPLLMENKSNIALENIKLSGGGYSLYLKNCNNITIDGCDVGYRTNSYGIGVRATTGFTSDNVIIRNCIISSGDSLYYTDFRTTLATYEGVLLENGITNSRVYNNYFYGWRHCGVYMSNLYSSFPFYGNEVYSNYITAPLLDYSRGLAADVTSNGYDNSFHDNIVINTNVRCQFNSNNLKVYNSIIDGTKGCPYPEKNSVGNGIAIEGYATPATNMEIYNNTIINCAEAGILITWYDATEKSYNNIHDNNLFNNGINSYLGYQTNLQLFSWTNSVSINNNTFSNNHIYSSATPNTVRYANVTKTVNEFNSTVTLNSDVISGNDAIINYSTPSTINLLTTCQGLHFYYNYNQSTPKTIIIASPQIDGNGVKYAIGSTVTLDGLSSKILMTDNNPSLNPSNYKKGGMLGSKFGLIGNKIGVMP